MPSIDALHGRGVAAFVAAAILGVTLTAAAHNGSPAAKPAALATIPAASASPTAGPAVEGPKYQPEVDAPSMAGWKIIDEASDDFNGSTLDTNKWWTYDGGRSDGGTLQNSQNTVGDGRLTITGAGAGKAGAISGGMQTAHASTYGRWTIRFREEGGNGYGAGVMLWPADEVWPDHGEIDIAEMPWGDRKNTYSTVHYGPKNRSVGTTRVPGDFTLFHTFTLEWTSDHIVEWLDGKEILHVTSPKEAIPRWPMRLAMQQDIGTIKCPGGWIQCANAATPPQVRMQVDYVHAYTQG